MSNQSFRQVFVTNNPALLASGSTVENLAVGQIGILDAKNHLAVTTPTYATTKAFNIVAGTPDLSGLPLLAGVPNENSYSKLVKGKKITNFRGHKAKRGQNQIITVGYSGDVSDTNTLFAKNGEIRRLYLTLTGGAIDKLFSKQGVTRQYYYESPLQNNCVDTCADANPREIANFLVKEINSDAQINRFIRASRIESCSPSLDPATTQTIYKFQLSVCDTQDDVALGLVQSQYPSAQVKRVGVNGSSSVYEIQSSVNSIPADYSNAGVVLIPDCTTCPSGYTQYPAGYVYVVKRQDSGTSGNLVTLKSDYSISATGEAAYRTAYEFGQSTYVVVSTVTIGSAVGTDILTFQGQSRNSCVITSPTTVSWAGAGTLLKYGKSYQITLGDNVCGTNRLAELQAYYPSLTIAIVNAAGSCVHTYSTTVYSQAVPSGCSVQSLTFVKPNGFDGVSWTATNGDDTAIPDDTTCLTGVKIEVAYVNRLTNECTFGYFPYEADTVYVSASTYDPNYHNAPAAGYVDWAVKQVQSPQFPAGFGAYVQKLEKESKSYELRERSFDPIVREAEGYTFQALTNNYYDEYVLDFEFSYQTNGWSQKTTDSYSVSVFFPEGEGKAFEAAVNSYLASASIAIDPVVL